MTHLCITKYFIIALHWAVRSRKIGSLQCLHDIVPWHFRNTSGEMFLDIFLQHPSPPLDDFYYYVHQLMNKTLNDEAGDATKKWTCLRSTEKWNSVAMDNLINLTGLREVKCEAIKLYCSVKEDMKRPVKARVSESSMYHFAFVGNPGVGKTTVAKLFADILVKLGLRENKFVETTGQKLVDDGVSKFPALLQSANPGVLFIDEVYQLDPKTNRDGMSIVNQLLHATETFRKQFTVIIGGYKEEVLEKFFSTNIGLPSRFTRIVPFENFDVEELRSIFLALVDAKAWTLQKPERGTRTTDIATIVAKRLYRGKDAKGYANARSARNYLELCIGRANERMVKERTNGKRLTDADRVTLKRVDIFGNEFVPEDSKLLKTLNEKIGMEAVKKGVRALAEIVKQNRMSEEAGEDVIDIVLHRVFLGNPGTGKTSIAKVYGGLLNEMGYLSNGDVIVVGASKLTGDVVGSASKKTNELLDTAAGKVLVIDEAYALANSIYGKEALDVLVERIQGGPGEDIAVILCGYESEMLKMMRDCNPGLSRRFRLEDAFRFEDYSDDELVIIMQQRAEGMGLYVSEDVAKAVVKKVLSRQRLKPNFGNVGAVNNLLDRGKERCMRRVADNVTGSSEKHEGKWVIIEADLRNVRKDPLDPATNPLFLELNGMIGLQAVKQSVIGLAHLAEENWKSEEAGEDVIDIVLHRVFLGNPGTGKTSIAKVYGRLLNEMGYLSNGEVVVVGASKLTGDAVGTSAKKTNELLDSAAGKVLVIDEAYVLANSIYGKEALDVLVERIQGGPGEDIAVILCGYESEMLKMMRDCNPGLSRRFRLEDAFRFEDYSDDELVIIMQQRAEGMGLYVSEDVAKAVVKKAISKQRAKPNFGNVGAVNNVLDRGKVRCMQRLANGSVEKRNGRIVFVEEDMISEPPTKSVELMLGQLYNADHITEHLTLLKKQVLVTRRKGGDEKTLIKNYIFTGPPGTGKTTVARALGEIDYELGLLSTSEVVECRATDLIAEYVGQSSGRVIEKMNAARGGVLFIDEAYGLLPSRSPFASDAIEALLGNMTDSKYQGNLVVILAGYPEQMQELMDSNSGLSRRFTERLSFKAWTPTDCDKYLRKLIRESKIGLRQFDEPCILNYFTDLCSRRNWVSCFNTHAFSTTDCLLTTTVMLRAMQGMF